MAKGPQPGQEMATELALKYRPTRLDEVIGQDQAVTLLRRKLAGKTLPHSVLLHGPTGTGKSTIARIIASELGCTDLNLTEINCADFRGIDTIREIRDQVRLAPMGGKVRIWILDEVVQLPKATQQAFLTLLEEPPDHVHFILCTSDLSGILPTFLGRCLQIHLQSLGEAEVLEMIERVLAGESRTISEKVGDAIIARTDGNARKALYILEAILSAEPEKQLAMVGAVSLDQDSFPKSLCQLIFKKVKWKDLVPVLLPVQDRDVEGLRRQTLAYACKLLLGHSNLCPLAYLVIQTFGENWTDSGKAGLVAACYRLHQETIRS